MKIDTKKIKRNGYYEAKIYKALNGIKKEVYTLYAYSEEQLEKEIKDALKVV